MSNVRSEAVFLKLCAAKPLFLGTGFALTTRYATGLARLYFVKLLENKKNLKHGMDFHYFQLPIITNEINFIGVFIYDCFKHKKLYSCFQNGLKVMICLIILNDGIKVLSSAIWGKKCKKTSVVLVSKSALHINLYIKC